MQNVQVTGRRPRGRPTAHWRDCVSWLVWVHLSVPSDKLEEVAGLAVLAWSAAPDKLMKMNGQVWTIDADGSHCWYKKLYDFR